MKNDVPLIMFYVTAFVQEEIHDADDTLFMIGKEFEDFSEQKIMFPVLSHTWLWKNWLFYNSEKEKTKTVIVFIAMKKKFSGTKIKKANNRGTIYG